MVRNADTTETPTKKRNDAEAPLTHEEQLELWSYGQAMLHMTQRERLIIFRMMNDAATAALNGLKIAKGFGTGQG